MMRRGFTLLEVLISIALLAIVMLALNHSVAILRDSNAQLLDHLHKAKDETKIINVLYADIAASDGNITIEGNEFSRLCINETIHTLYELPSAKVCWIVLKEDNQLARMEGNGYSLPVKDEDRVEIDRLTNDIDVFSVYHQDDKVIVMLRQKGKEATSFMMQGIAKNDNKKTAAGVSSTPTATQTSKPQATTR